MTCTITIRTDNDLKERITELFGSAANDDIFIEPEDLPLEQDYFLL